MDELFRLRQEIDQIDDEVLTLLNRRARAALEIGKAKAREQREAYVPSREREIVQRLQAQSAGPFPSTAIHNVFREIISGCLSLEQPLKVAYLGPEASFTHMACKQQFGLSARYLPSKSIADVFDTVARGRSDYGVVPIENSTEGVVNHTLDLFVAADLVICAEILLEVSHHLLSRADSLAEVTKIYSHPQAFGQCRNWLKANMEAAVVIDVASTALAAQLATEDSSAAAIASELAGQLYGLRVLSAKIEDSTANYTRFLVIGRREAEPTGDDKTSLMVSLKDEPGILHRVLRPFDELQVNLSKIESRPSKKKAWEYIFFIDVDGHIQTPAVAEAVAALAESCELVKVLGSYPKGKNP